MKGVLLSFALLLCCCAYRVVAVGNGTLTLAVFVSAINTTASFTGESNVGAPFVAAVKLAVELINNDTSLIPGYNLDFELTDAQCAAGPSVRGFIDQIFMEPTKIMIIGADCSTSTEPIAELAPFWNLVQISPVSSSPVLSRNETYSTFLRMVSSDVAAAEGVVNLMLKFNWTRVSVVSQQENIFSSTFARLRQELMQANITDDPREFNFNSDADPTSVVERVMNSPSRILLLNVYPAYGLEIMCQAYRLGMTHSNGYLWLLHAWYPETWWTSKPAERSYEPVICEQEELEEMIKYAIIVDHYASVDDEERLRPTNVSGLTREMFDALLEERLVDALDTSLASQAQFYFDAVWAAGLALHNVVVTGHNLSAFSYDPADSRAVEMSSNIFKATRSLEFVGMSGPVRFNDVGDRFPMLRYFQYLHDNSSKLFRSQVSGESGFVFPFGVPDDEEFVYISLPLFAAYTILALAGILFALVCIAVNLWFREKKVVKLSSPYLNVLIIIGVILYYADVILFGIDADKASRCTVNALCMVRLWIASIAFSLVFGTIFVKTWRVYYIFYSSNRHKRNKKTLIQDWVLFLMVGVLVAVDVVFMLFVTIFPSSRLTLQNNELQSNSQALPRVVGLCRAENRFIWLGILFVYKGILLIVGVFLAFETRNVKIRHLNDSKLIGMSVYGMVVLSVALAAVGVLLESYVDTFYAVIGIMLMLGNTSLLFLIFIPKFYKLWKDPEGLSVMKGEATTANSLSPENKETISQLNHEIQKLKSELNRLNSFSSPLKEAATEEEMSSTTSDSKVPIRSPDSVVRYSKDNGGPVVSISFGQIDDAGSS